MGDRPLDPANQSSFLARGAQVTPSAPPPIAVDPPGWGVSPFYLFFRPTSFFTQYLERLTPAVILIATYAFGMGAVIDQLAERALRSQLGGGTSIWQSVANSWSGYWLACLAGGALSASLVWYLGGWWYRKRLQWSGATEADPGLARKVYVFASLIYVVPLLCYTLWETAAYATPAEAFSGDDLWGVALMVFVFWSVGVSYLGVRAIFPVRAWPSRIWFLILPSGIQAVSLIVLVGLFLFGGALFEQEPDVDQLAALESSAVALRYPGNWTVDTSDAPQAYSFAPFLDDATFTVFVYDFPLDPLQASMDTLDRLSADATIHEMEAIDRWGDYDGKGFELVLGMQGNSYHATTFSVSDARVSFEIIELSLVDATERLDPGFRAIRDSFVFRPGEVVAAGMR